MKNRGFTLAEIMIVLSIIGILTAILLPIANHSRPDENVMKFKKADTTLKNVIRELVNSDNYYCNGDLGLKADCKTLLLNDGSLNSTYLCNSFAEQLSVKKTSCVVNNVSGTNAKWMLSNENLEAVATGSQVTRTVTEETILATKKKFDEECKKSGKLMGAEIITTDDIVYYQAGKTQFGTNLIQAAESPNLSEDIHFRKFSPPGQIPANYSDQNGFDIVYKIFCIDVDGIPDNATTTDCKNECPFGYGVRADGRILNGKRADEWLTKGFQKGSNEN